MLIKTNFDSELLGRGLEHVKQALIHFQFL